MRTLIALVSLGLGAGCAPLVLQPIDGQGGGGAGAGTGAGAGAGESSGGAVCNSAKGAQVWSDVKSIAAAPDPAGGYFFGGCFVGDLSLGGGFELHGPKTNPTHFFARMGADGVATYATAFGDRCSGEGRIKVVSNENGEAALVDVFLGEANVGGTTISAGSRSVLVARYADGAITGQTFPFGLSEDTRMFFLPAAMSPTGEIALSVSAGSTVDFDNEETQYDGANVVVLSPALNVVYLKRYPNSRADDHSGLEGLSFGADGTLFASGSVMGKTNFDGQIIDPPHRFEGFVMALDSTGHPRWFTGFPGDIDVSSVAAAAQGGAWIGGAGRGPLVIDGKDLLASKKGGAFAIRVDAGGSPLVGAALTDSFPSGGVAVSLAPSPDGGAFIAGSFGSERPPGDLPLPATQDATHTWVGALDASAGISWACPYESTRRDYATSVILDGAGQIVLLGQVRGTIDFGAGPGTATGHLPGTYVARFQP